MTAIYSCGSELRRQRVRDSNQKVDGLDYNGIDYLEVVDLDAVVESLRQRTLLVRFFKKLPIAIGEDNVRLEGGVRIRPVRVEWAFRADQVPGLFFANAAEAAFIHGLADPDTVLVVRTDVAGDFSAYQLSIVTSPTQAQPPSWLDPRLATIEFSFKVECPDELDCRVVHECPVERLPEPEIDYLAKDYATFRHLMLDRLSVTMPQWRERSPADLQVALVELLASVGDELSYQQDAVATEAYLGTARRRVSVRRHARLLDYDMHEGCNARVWVTFEIANGSIADGTTIAAGTPLLPRDDQGALVAKTALDTAPFVFETMHDLTVWSDNGTIEFYTWDDEACCLPTGATAATLSAAPQLSLAVGDVLVLEERIGTLTGLAGDADTSHRQAVRLTAVTRGVDPLTQTNVVDVEWHEADALRFPLCLSARVLMNGIPTLVRPGVARGNVVLADTGRTILDEPLSLNAPNAPRYRPQLGRAGVTFGEAYVDRVARSRPAAEALRQDSRRAMPLRATLFDGAETWTPQRDLLGSDRFSPEFVIEMERDRTAYVRFGDDVLGKRPEEGTAFTATYRVGLGKAGNVGAEAIGCIVEGLSGILRVRNPMSATGGIEPESMEEVRQFAPVAFRTQKRAVTEADYATAAERHPDVQKASARFHWTGSWFTVFLTIDRRGGRPVAEDPAFAKAMHDHIETFRLAGYDIEIRGPVFVPLELTLMICVKPGYFRAQVRDRLERAFSARDLPAGGRGFFHPDNFTFGQPVYLSRIFETATDVAGVASVEVVLFRRFGRPAAREKELGVLQPSDTEIIQLDNDPSRPERGAITFDIRGGL